MHRNVILAAAGLSLLGVTGTAQAQPDQWTRQVSALLDQFGVELGKQLANGLLPALKGEAQASDPVTQALLAELKARS